MMLKLIDVNNANKIYTFVIVTEKFCLMFHVHDKCDRSESMLCVVIKIGCSLFLNLIIVCLIKYVLLLSLLLFFKLLFIVIINFCLLFFVTEISYVTKMLKMH